jgi:hypothetical protein
MRSLVLKVVIGALSALLLAEAGARVVLEDLPDAREWPTPETEIKNAQLVRLSREGVDLDVVFVGSSAVEAGVDPDRLRERTGLLAYNAALPFSTALSNEFWLRRFVLPLTHPDTVVIGLSVWAHGSPVEDDLLATGLQAVASREGSGMGLAIVDRRRQLRSWSDSAMRLDQLRSGVFTALGHQTAYYDMSIAHDEGPRFVGSETAQMAESDLAALRRTIKMLDDQSIEVVLFLEPVGCPPKVAACSRFSVADHPGLALASEFDLEVIDAASQPWPSGFYADTAHFNRSGTEALTDFVARALDISSGAR